MPHATRRAMPSAKTWTRRPHAREAANTPRPPARKPETPRLWLEDLKRAEARVGLHAASPHVVPGLSEERSRITARARWLIEFARYDVRPEALVGLSTRERNRIRLEAGLFAKGRRFSFASEDIPDEAAVREAQRRVRELFTQLSDGNEAVIVTERWAGALVIRGGVVTQTTPWDPGIPFVDGFLIQVHELLPWLQLIHARLHFCSECHAPFLAKRSDATLCSSPCRTRSWRKANPEHLRASRKAAYKQHVAKRLGKAVHTVRI